MAGGAAFKIICVVVLAIPALWLFVTGTTAAQLADGFAWMLFLGSAAVFLIPAAVLALISAVLPRHWTCAICKNVWRA